MLFLLRVVLHDLLSVISLLNTSWSFLILRGVRAGNSGKLSLRDSPESILMKKFDDFFAASPMVLPFDASAASSLDIECRKLQNFPVT